VHKVVNCIELFLEKFMAVMEVKAPALQTRGNFLEVEIKQVAITLDDLGSSGCVVSLCLGRVVVICHAISIVPVLRVLLLVVTITL
jgi:hypothetical protein